MFSMLYCKKDICIVRCFVSFSILYRKGLHYEHKLHKHGLRANWLSVLLSFFFSRNVIFRQISAKSHNTRFHENSSGRRLCVSSRQTDWRMDRHDELFVATLLAKRVCKNCVWKRVLEYLKYLDKFKGWERQVTKSQSKHNFICVQTSYMFRLYIAIIRLDIEP